MTGQHLTIVMTVVFVVAVAALVFLAAAGPGL
jgi:hypothetical protein